MSQSLLAKLDELQGKVLLLSNALEQSRAQTKQLREATLKLNHENEQLRQQIATAQTQVSDMLTQWFPELGLNTENQIGCA